jgi:hypothetical protein
MEQCPSPGKHPRIKPAHRRHDPRRASCRGECGQLGHGVWDATSDLGQVAEWLAAWPDTNWGAVPPAGVFVLDVDPRGGGHHSLVALQNQHGALPRTLTARTGGDGWHIWLRHPSNTGDAGERLAGKLAAGIDVKKPGGYVVIPPATHASGGSYAWTRMTGIAQAPRWVTDQLTPTTPDPVPAPVPRGSRRAGSERAGRDRISGLVAFVAHAAEGERNRCLFWAACRAAELGADTTDLIAAATQAGLAHHEALATVASATRTSTTRTSTSTST